MSKTLMIAQCARGICVPLKAFCEDVSFSFTNVVLTGRQTNLPDSILVEVESEIMGLAKRLRGNVETGAAVALCGIAAGTELHAFAEKFLDGISGLASLTVTNSDCTGLKGNAKIVHVDNCTQPEQMIRQLVVDRSPDLVIWSISEPFSPDTRAVVRELSQSAQNATITVQPGLGIDLWMRSQGYISLGSNAFSNVKMFQ